MLYVLIGLAIIMAFFVFFSPAENAIIHDQLNSRPDNFLDSEEQRLSRWFSHYHSGPQSFRDKANSSGAKDKYQKYREQISDEQARRQLIRTLIASVPELKLAGEFAYVNMLNDGMAKIAWEMHKAGKPREEIISWFQGELGSSNEPKKAEPKITIESLVNALIETSANPENLQTVKRAFGESASTINPEALEIIGIQMNSGFGLRLIKERFGVQVWGNVNSLFEQRYLMRLAESGILNLKGTFSPTDLVPNKIEYGFVCAENGMCREPLLDREMLPFVFAFIFTVRNRIHYERADLKDSKEAVPYNNLAQQVIYQVLGPEKMNSLPSVSAALSKELVSISNNLEAAIIKNAA